MRNNKLIKAQYERLLEINMQRGALKFNSNNFEDEAKIYGFLNLRTFQNEKDNNQSD
jgi:hypothetical protein